MIIPEGIQEFQDLDDGVYLAKIETAQEKTHDDGRLYYQLQFRVSLPEIRVGQIRTESFWVGTEEDPSASTQQTWLDSFGAKALKGICKKLGVPFDGRDTAEVMQNLVGGDIMIELETRQYKNKEGVMKTVSNLRRTYVPGERDPFIKPLPGAPLVAGGPPAGLPPQQPVQPAQVPTPAYAPPAAPAGAPPGVPPAAPQQQYVPPAAPPAGTPPAAPPGQVPPAGAPAYPPAGAVPPAGNPPWAQGQR